MQQYFSIPLLFFFIASSLGLLLRWHFISPLESVRYPYLLHAHSHIMFLGWVFNTLYLAYVNSYVRTKWISRYRALFIMLQILVLGMLISFPLQGYGLFSIIFSTLHTILAGVFLVLFFQDLKQENLKNSASVWFVKTSLFFFLLSSLGPFSLGFLMANGLGQSNWYYFAVYFYLHFQYNGFFLFGVLGLFFKLLEENNVLITKVKVLQAGLIMAIACLPAYFLSVLWANPGWIFTTVGFVAAVFQIISLILFIKIFNDHQRAIKAAFNPFSVSLLLIILAAFTVKIVLQLLSVDPDIARLAYQFRPYVIAYLHLVLLGIISLFLLVWYTEKGFVQPTGNKPAFVLYIFGLTGMEVLLIAGPSWNNIFTYPVIVLEKGILAFATALWISAGWFIFSSSKWKKDVKS